MADAQRALAWILERSEKIDLSIHHHEWIEEIFPDWIDLGCSFKFSGRNVHTWGAAENHDLALLKSFSESMERIAMHEERSRTSNGFAAHLDAEKSRQAAINELIERDLFLCHFLTNTAFPRFEAPSNWYWLSDAVNWLNEKNLKLDLYQLGEKGILARIDGARYARPFGFVMGLSYKSVIEDSALSAFIEAGRNISLDILSPFPEKPISLNEFNSQEAFTFSLHGRLALDLEYSKSVSHLFDTTASIANPRETDIRDINCRRIEIKDLDFADSPFVISKAESKRAQDLFLGKTNPSLLNFERLSEFGRKTQTIDTINKLPHFLD